MNNLTICAHLFANYSRTYCSQIRTDNIKTLGKVVAMNRHVDKSGRNLDVARYDIQKLEAYYKVGRSLFFHLVMMSFSMRGWDSFVATVELPYSLADDG